MAKTNCYTPSRTAFRSVAWFAEATELHYLQRAKIDPPRISRGARVLTSRISTLAGPPTTACSRTVEFHLDGLVMFGAISEGFGPDRVCRNPERAASALHLQDVQHRRRPIGRTQMAAPTSINSPPTFFSLYAHGIFEDFYASSSSTITRLTHSAP